jgi:hypothetical protein
MEFLRGKFNARHAYSFIQLLFLLFLMAAAIGVEIAQLLATPARAIYRAEIEKNRKT